MNLCVSAYIPVAPRAGAFCFLWALFSTEGAPGLLQTGYSSGREGSRAAEAQIRQFWAPGQKHLALPVTVPAVATTGWWEGLALSPSLAVRC